MKEFPINNSWYNILWVSLVLIVFTLGEILSRSKYIIKKIKFISKFLILKIFIKVLIWSSILIIPLIWYLYYVWAF